MPRKSRIDAPGALQHIIAGGINRDNIFSDDIDRNNFIKRLSHILIESKTVCYAWALMPSHFHLLLRTGVTPISKVMCRLLTGYAISYNHRHARYGHLFQNRYKSILCQEDAYLLELVRYIHLNPLRAKSVTSLDELDHYPYCGHGALIGTMNHVWQDTEHVLRLFYKTKVDAHKQYRKFIQKGMAKGKNPELTGGGLLRSQGGWPGVKALRRTGTYQKGDERILGSSHFVDRILSEMKENAEGRYQLKAQGYTLNHIAKHVAKILHMDLAEVLSSGKNRRTVLARSLLSLWATHKLGISQIQLARQLHVTQPAISQAVRRGERLVQQHHYSLNDH